MTPESNGLVTIATAKQPKERGFNCMKLIGFLTEDSVYEWEQWHGAHIQAFAGQCPYREQCDIYARTIEVHGRKPLQLSLFD